MSDNEALKGFQFLGIIGGLRPQASVEEEPALALSAWRAFRVPSGAIHLAGHCKELFEGRASTAVVACDRASSSCTTASGRQYKLSGPPGRLDSDAAWVWGQFKRINALSDEEDVSDRLFSLLEGSAVAQVKSDDVVPFDFPPDEPAPFALGGSQPKFSVIQGPDGRFYQPGTEPGHRLARYRASLAEVEWSVDLLAGKLLKPKYRVMPRDAVLARLRVVLVRDRLWSEAESDWILRRVVDSSRLEWTH
jgi:hypothetical protein